MSFYLSHGEFQQRLKEFSIRHQRKLDFMQMAEHLFRKEKLQTSYVFPKLQDWYKDLSGSEFEAIVNSLPLIIEPAWGMPVEETVKETDIIPTKKDVFAILHLRYTRHQMHAHNYFEINYVQQGQCNFFFEKTSRTMHEGELCIIAPNSQHDLTIDDDSTVYTIMIRRSTFDTTFFSLLSQNDLLSHFFRTILQEKTHTNYLLFFTKTSDALEQTLRNLILENNKGDTYSNNCCISWINLFFSIVLRNYSETIQFYNYQMGSDFSLILQYIQHNYQTLTLSSLAELFHYSEPYLSTLIRQNTGFTFIDLIKRLRLADAVHYLKNSDLKIAEIAELVGYHSADHFSRVFRQNYQISPQEYRKNNKSTSIPFEYH